MCSNLLLLPFVLLTKDTTILQSCLFHFIDRRIHKCTKPKMSAPLNLLQNWLLNFLPFMASRRLTEIQFYYNILIQSSTKITILNQFIYKIHCILIYNFALYKNPPPTPPPQQPKYLCIESALDFISKLIKWSDSKCLKNLTGNAFTINVENKVKFSSTRVSGNRKPSTTHKTEGEYERYHGYRH